MRAWRRQSSVLAGVIIVSSVIMTASTVAQQQDDVNHHEDKCSFDAATDILQCSLRTLNSKNSSVISASRAKGIRVKCSDVFFYESYLKTNHFGYLPELQSLTLDYCKIRKIPNLAFSGLSDLRTLEIVTRNSEWSAMEMTLEKDSLTGLENLVSLNLTQNNIWSLPQNAFCQLKKLQVLNLSGNFIQDVQEIGFDSSRCSRVPLSILDLSNNGIAKLPMNSFSQLNSLTDLDLSGNLISLIHDRALAGLKDLSKLDVSNNELVAVPPEVFRDFKSSMRELYLQNNSLSTLSPGLFEGMSELLVLNLSRNELTNDWLDTSTFASLTNLVALDLSRNRLTEIQRHLFSEMKSLKILNLAYNRIHTIEAHALVGQLELHILYLSYNHLEHIHAKAIQDLPKLSSLSLDHNQLRTLKRNLLKNCSNLQDLALQHNRLIEVPKAIKSLPLLRTLDIGDNQIAEVESGAFNGLEHLYGLRLAGNAISSLHNHTFDTVPSLQVLNLAHNQIARIELGTLVPLTKLKMLRLDNNKIEDINGLLGTQSELRWLNISANRLVWFDYGLLPRSVRWLDLHQNHVERFENYYNLTLSEFNIQTMDFSENKLFKLEPRTLPANVEYLILNDNAISEVGSGTFADLSKLSRLELKNNLITKITPNALGLHDNSQAEIFLSGNPLICDCEMEWLQKVSASPSSRRGRHSHPRIVDLESTTCTLPSRSDNNNNKPYVMTVTEVRPEDFLCPYKSHCFALCQCCHFFGCDCRMQCPSGCDCFRDSTWSSNLVTCSSRGHKVIPELIPMDATAIHLDGNSFETGVLESQSFIGRKRVKELFLNNSKIEAINNQTFNGLTELETLRLDDNLLTRLEGFELQNLTSLQELYLQNNNLYYIGPEAFSSLVSLRVLRLDGNNLSEFPVWNLANLPELREVYLARNSWSCDCEFVQKFKMFLRTSNILIPDMDRVHCISEDKKDLFPIVSSENVTCSDVLAVKYQDDTMMANIIPVLVGVSALVVIVIIVSIIVFVFRTPLRVWLHSKYGVRVLDASGKAGRGKLYDAFVSYSLKDEDFVQQVIVPNLEHVEPGYKLCLQHRDLPSSSTINETFPGISQLCAKHLIVVTRAYIATEWRQMKYTLQDGKVTLRPVLIFLEELTNLDLAAAPEFNILMKTSVVLKWNETGFWNKLRFYLPDCMGRLRSPTFPPSVVDSSASSSSSSSSSSHAMRKPVSAEYESAYDAIIPSNNSSTSTRSTIMGGSPRAFNNNSNSQGVQLAANPLDSQNGLWHQQQPVYDEHTYQTIDSSSESNHHAVGCVDVMLPNGRMVPATLYRNPVSGKIVPLVQVDSVISSTTSSSSSPNRQSQTTHRGPSQNYPVSLNEEQQPLRQQQHQKPHSHGPPHRHQEVTFPRGRMFNSNLGDNGRGKGHLV